VLAKARLLLVGAPDHALAGRTAGPDDLRRFELCMSDASGDYNDLLLRRFQELRLPPPRVQALGSIEGVKRALLVRRGALGLLPAHAVESELREGALAEVRLAPALPGLVLRALHARGRPPSPLADELVRGLRGARLGL
jgi:DNA-binding transcriptional LysR family regulator